MDMSVVIDRISDQVSSLRKVAGSADLVSAAGDLKQVPAAYVLPLAEQAAENELASGAVSQRRTIRFGVLLGVVNLRDPRGDAAQGDLDTLRTSLMSALLGWSPGDAYDPVEFGGGRLMQLDDQVLWWQDEFVTASHVRAT